jgi:hypothetical protein
MEPDCVSLPVRRRGSEKDLFLMRVTDAIRVCRDGELEALPGWRIASYADALGGLPEGALRDFAARARLFGDRLSERSDAELLARVRTALRYGELTLVTHGQNGGGDGATDATTEQRRLAKAIEDKTRRRLSFSGRQYRLVADVDMGRMRDRDSYEVVRREDAVKVLQGIARDVSADPGLGELLNKAGVLLTRDWRPPLQPSGLVLLRRNQARQAPIDAPEAALTPSQLKKAMTKTEWIEIVLTDDLGKPYTGPYEIQLPDGSTVTGSFDEQGMWADYDIEPGTCKMMMPDIPEQVKPGTMTSFIALKIVDEDGAPIEDYDYSLLLANGDELEGKTDGSEIRAEGVAPGECTFTLKKAS